MSASLIALLFLAVSPVADQTAPAFAIHLPTVKVDHHGAEYWAEIKGPAGASAVAVARVCR